MEPSYTGIMSHILDLIENVDEKSSYGKFSLNTILIKVFRV